MRTGAAIDEGASQPRRGLARRRPQKGKVTVCNFRNANLNTGINFIVRQKFPNLTIQV